MSIAAASRRSPQRQAVEPIVSKPSLEALQILIRERAQTTLDRLPIDEPFNWVDLVSIELTTQLLATRPACRGERAPGAGCLSPMAE